MLCMVTPVYLGYYLRLEIHGGWKLAGRTTNAAHLLVFTSRRKNDHAIMIYPEKDSSDSYITCL